RLPPPDVAAFAACCRRFRAAASHDAPVWGRICAALLARHPPAAAASPAAWGLPTYHALYTKLLRVYGELLGTWCGDAAPLGSLLVVYPSPPYIVGAAVSSLRLGDPGVSVVPLFQLSYDAVRGVPAAACLRRGNMLAALARRRQQHVLLANMAAMGEDVEEEEDEQLPDAAVLQLQYEYDKVAGGTAAADADGATQGGGAEEREQQRLSGGSTSSASSASSASSGGSGGDAGPSGLGAAPRSDEHRAVVGGWSCGGCRLASFRLSC
ncbi:hypothetical protein TSOC_015368, partial [Tetrabaena socialis]